MTDAIIHKLIQKRLHDQGIDWVILRTIRISREEGELTAEIELEGEVDPIEVILSYELEKSGILIRGANASRPWVTGVLRAILASKGGRFPFPAGMMGSMARMVL